MNIFIVLTLMQLKHFIADYPLQTPYMLGKFKEKGWVKPLLAHSGVQALCTFLVCLAALAPSFDHLWLAFVLPIANGLIHFVMDRIKAAPQYLGRYKALSANEFPGVLDALGSTQSGFVCRGNELVMTGRTVGEAAALELKNNKYFWWALGFDQMVHHLTDLLTAYIIYRSM